MADKANATQTGIVPNLWVEAVEPLRDFYIEKLGFDHAMGVVGKDGNLDFCIVQREGQMVMMGRPLDGGVGARRGEPLGRPVEIYLHATGIDAYHAEVTKRGVRLEKPLVTQWWGDRNFGVLDPYGYLLWFYETVAELNPPPGVTMV